LVFEEFGHLFLTNIKNGNSKKRIWADPQKPFKLAK
jgi:hypothetical protein